MLILVNQERAAKLGLQAEGRESDVVADADAQSAVNLQGLGRGRGCRLGLMERIFSVNNHLVL